MESEESLDRRQKELDKIQKYYDKFQGKINSARKLNDFYAGKPITELLSEDGEFKSEINWHGTTKLWSFSIKKKFHSEILNDRWSFINRSEKDFTEDEARAGMKRVIGNYNTTGQLF